MRHCFVSVTLLILWIAGYAEEREFESVTTVDGKIVIKVSDGHYEIESFKQEAFNVSFFPDSGIIYEASHAVAMPTDPVAKKVRRSAGEWQYSNGSLSLNVRERPFELSFSYNDKTILTESSGYFDHDTLQGFAFRLQEDEVLYGGGERALGMNRRGKRLELYNTTCYGYGDYAENMYYSMPIVISSKQYLLLWDNPRKGYLDLGATDRQTLSIEASGGPMRYVVVGGDGMVEVTQNYTRLTGLQPLPPRWSFGNYASRFGYRSQNEVSEVVTGFQTEEIPLDVAVLDLFWFGPHVFNHMGTLDWNKDSFPNGPQMISDLESNGVKTMLVSEPFILTSSKRWQEAVDRNLLCKNIKGEVYKYKFYFGVTGLIDIFKPEVQDWFWEIYKGQYNQGVAGFWCDLGEPEAHPSDLVHINGMAEDVHSIYGHTWAKTISEGMKRDFPKHRSLILMRSGYAGTQRFGVVTWSGDVARTWEGLGSQTEIALQMGMQGIGYHHSDLGGFAGDKGDAELYTRWLQYGVFQPIFRPHGQDVVPSEPIFWPDSVKELAKRSVELRYRLLPYNYTMAYDNATKGTPLMRPLIFEEPENLSLADNSQTYLWGNDFLVTPITSSGIDSVEIYFPKSGDWVDYYSGQVVAGGQYKKVEVVKDHIPIYVRNGAIITSAYPFQNEANYRTDSLRLDVYLHDSAQSCSGYFFDDDGNSAETIQRKEYEMFHYQYSSLKNGKGKLIIESNGGTYEGAPSHRTFDIYLHTEVDDGVQVQLHGEQVPLHSDADGNTISFQGDFHLKPLEFLIDRK